jgi:membrane protease YdiL (CAAX protease family)
MQPLTTFLKRYSLSLGLLLMFLLTWPIDLANAGVLPFQVPMPMALLLGWGFIAASLAMTGLTLGRGAVVGLLKRFTFWRVGWRWWLIAGLLFPAIGLAAVVLNAVLTRTAPDFSTVYAFRIFGPGANLPPLIVPFFLLDAVTNGEEMGWRGYVLPRLQRTHSALWASLVLGVIWGFWHLPRFLAPGHSGSFVLLLADTVIKSVLYTWLFSNTRGSLLVVTVFHATSNTVGVFLPMANVPGPQLNVFMLAIGIELLVASGVTLATGPVWLARRGAAQAIG